MIARWSTAALLAATVTTFAHNASAEANGFGEPHQLIISADRLVPVLSIERRSVEEELPNATRTTTTTGSSASLLFGSPNQRLTPHTIPRAAIDFTVIPNLTVGGFVALGLGLGGSRTTTTVTNNVRTETEFDTGSGTAIGFGPRVGYILPLNDFLAFWPRGGLSFYTMTTRSDDDANNTRRRVSVTDTNVSLDLDPQLVITPFEHFFFTVGALVNVPVTGSTSVEIRQGATTVTTDNDLSSFHIGLNAGLGGWFNL